MIAVEVRLTTAAGEHPVATLEADPRNGDHFDLFVAYLRAVQDDRHRLPLDLAAMKLPITIEITELQVIEGTAEEV